jgi:uncharacterized protein (DUF2141 family)
MHPTKVAVLSLSLLTALACAAPAAYAATPGALTLGECAPGGSDARLQVTVDGLRSDKGNVTVVVYGDQPSDFLAKGKKLVKVHIPAKTGTLKACVKLPKPGRYAVAAYHDEDGDHKLNRNLIGMPVEGYAFSNNPKNYLVMPSYSSVSFQAQAKINPLPLLVHYP